MSVSSIEIFKSIDTITRILKLQGCSSDSVINKYISQLFNREKTLSRIEEDIDIIKSCSSIYSKKVDSSFNKICCMYGCCECPFEADDECIFGWHDVDNKSDLRKLAIEFCEALITLKEVLKDDKES